MSLSLFWLVFTFYQSSCFSLVHLVVKLGVFPRQGKILSPVFEFMRRIGARTLSERLRRAGLSLARTSFLLLDLHFSCRLFRRAPHHYQPGSLLIYLYYKAYTAIIVILTLRSISQRHSSIMFALAQKPTTKTDKQPLPEVLRLAGEVGMFATKRLRIKRHRRIR
jgi:hypothetical protein